MVWFDPSERIVAEDASDPSWLSIQEEEGFILQQYQPHVDETGSCNPGEFRFRVVLRANKLCLLVAHADRFETVIDHWSWLENEIIPQIRLLDDLPTEELFQFSILKISSYIRAMNLNTNAVDQGRISLPPDQFFNTIYPDEQLISYYPCSLWDNVLLKGCLYMSVQTCFFYSPQGEQSIFFPIAEITTVSLQESGMIPNSIQIYTLSISEILFSNFEDVGRVYEVLNGIWEYNTSLVLQIMQHDMDELNWELDMEDDSFEPSITIKDPSRFSSWRSKYQEIIDSTTEQGFIEYYHNTKFQKQFRLPRSDSLLSSGPCVMEGWGVGHIKDVPGTIFVSDHFVCFHGGDIEAIIYFDTILGVELRFHEKLVISTEKRRFKFSSISPKSDVVVVLLNLWDNEWKNESLDVSQVRDSIAHQWQESREKGVLFKGEIGDLSDDQRKAWSQYEKVNGFGMAMIKTPELLSLVRSGLPRRLRGKIWNLLSGSIYKRDLWPLEYRNIVKESENLTSLATEEIGRDLNRTFPEHPFYQKENGRNLLRRVLTSYSLRNPSIGYCQSMNIVTAFQMLFMQEEEAYWMAVAVCEDFLPDYYSSSMVGCTTDQQVFESLLDKYMPDLFQHFIELAIPITLITIPWLLCTFVGFLSWATTLRILDCFFLEGRKILFQIGLSIFKIYRAELITYDDPVDVIETLKNCDVECSHLFEVAFGDFGEITEEDLDILHKKHRAMVVKESERKMEKRKQSAALQLGKSHKSRRNTTVYTLYGSSDSTPTIRRSKLSQLRANSASDFAALRVKPAKAAKVAKKVFSKVKKTQVGGILSFRSSSSIPIVVSSVFKPEEVPKSQ